MRKIAIALMLVTSLAALTNIASAQAQSQKFPYDAVIADDEVYTRSGPGQKFYPTARLRNGEHVSVIRHDPGGWFMIEPPPGSFAWVRAEFVKRQDDRGVIKSDTPVVGWIGTSFGDDHYVSSRYLQPGEEVEILGEKTLKDERGEVNYLRIKSPKGHFRWIPGAKIVSSEKQLSAANSRARRSDPFTGESKSAPVNMVSHEPNEAGSVAADDKSVPAPRDPGRRPAPTPKNLEEDSPQPFAKSKEDKPKTFVPLASESSSDSQQRLATVDQHLQDMLKRETRDWDFTAIEAELHDLQTNDATSAAAARRLASLGKYKQVKADYDSFARIMEETSRRDAELAAAQQARQAPGTVTPVTRPQTSTPSNNFKSAPLTNSNGQNQIAAPGRSTAPAIQSRPAPTKGRFGGAGIIQRSGANQSGLPKYVLVHPNGQRLAYLQGDGVDLDKYVGESMGLDGERTYRPELKSDLMIVKSLQPVKLRP